ncbi:MAG TPA: HAMP domain-containing sensor histidine kinase [Dermatophilaceae bacterium]|nr:HAMP domain-containing sensor histidine kinase [Dermatophilaceae bacterium]
MNRLAVRFAVSHLLVAVVAALTTFLVVRQLAPSLFDESLRRGIGAGQGSGQPGGPGPSGGRPGPSGGGTGQGEGLRQSFADAVDLSLLVGGLVGGLVAAVVGALVARRLLRPLGRVREATRRMAEGDYRVPVPMPMERELADLVSDVNVLGAALGDTESRRVRLLGEVAHEMRTPLTVIDGYVEGMIDGIITVTDEDLGQVSEEVRRLRRLADDLSALSRAEEGRLVLRRQTSDLRTVVERAAERLRPQVEDAGIVFIVDLGSEALPSDTDADRIAQVATNLVGNAVRATRPGGRIEVRVGRGQPQGGETGAGHVGDPVWFTVTDTGVGLRPEDVTRVFERFYRVPAPASDRQVPSATTGPGSRPAETGSGIGLTIARGIARAHGGDVTAASDGLGRGARFTCVVPRAGAGSSPGQAVIDQPAGPAPAR